MRWQFTGLVLLSIFFQCNGLWAQTPGSFYALGLGGKSAHVLIPDDSSLNVTGSITVEAWVKPDSFKSGNNDNCILSKHGAKGGYDLRCNKNGGVNFRFGTSAGWKFIVSTSKLKQGEWHHVAGTFNGDSSCIYVNGQLERVKKDTGRIGTSYGLSAKIGEFSRSGISALPGGNFDGHLDEIRLWNAALSAEQIAKWMCMKITSTHPHYMELKANWRFDDATGSTVSDYSPYKNDGSTSKVNWLRSGAPLGDTAVFAKNGMFQYKTSSGDEVTIKSRSNLNKGAYLYHVMKQSFDTELATGLMMLDSQYFGFFSLDSSVFEYDFHYAFSSSRNFSKTGECHLDLVVKNDRTNIEWEEAVGRLDILTDSIHLLNSSNQEVHLAKYFDKRKIKYLDNDTVLCENEKLTLKAYGNSNYAYRWYRDGKLLPADTLNYLVVNDSAVYSAEAQRLTSCQYRSISRSVRTIKIPKVRLRHMKPQCEYLDTFVLSGGNPLGGLYSGWLVVKDSLILPSSFSTGIYPVFYSFTDSNNCTNTDTQDFIIQPKPKAFFKGKSTLCDNKDSLHIRLLSPVGGSVIGAGVHQNIFYTDSIKGSASEFDLTYFYSDSAGCLDTAYGKLELLQSSKIVWKSFNDTCENVGPVKLVTNAKPSSFYGKGVQNDHFYPSIAGKGKHTLYTSFTNTYGCTSMDSNTIEVIQVDKASFSINDSICSNGDSVHLKNATPIGGEFIGSGVTSKGYFHPRATSSGQQEIGYVYTNAGGCKDTALSSMLVLDTIKLSKSTIKPICNNALPLQLDHIQPKGGVYALQGVRDSFFRATDHLPGNYHIRYQLRASNTCISTATLEIEVLESTLVEVKLASNTACRNGDSIKIDLTPNLGGQLSGMGINDGYVVPSLLDSGLYKLLYTFKDSSNCSYSDSTFLSVTAVPNVSLELDTIFCANHEVLQLSNQGSPLGGTFTIDQTTGKILDPSKLSLGLHVLAYRFTNADNCTDSAQKVIDILQAPDVPVIIEQNGLLSSSAKAGNQWFSNGKAIANEAEQSIAPDKSGYYYVEVSNENCSSFSDSIYFQVLSTPNAGNQGIQLYPNPASETIFIQAEGTHIKRVRLYGFQGNFILEETIVPLKKFGINIEKLTSGVYWINVETESGEHHRLRFIKP